MNSDYTQQQSLNGLQRAEQLSLQSTVPPADISGYKIEKLLGQGAFGQVWMGRDLNTGRQIAIKFYLHRGGVDASLLTQEVKHLVNMSTGRYIVQILAVGWEAEPPYYVMEYLENGSLEDLVRARGALGIVESVSMLREIADGLSYAHGKGLLHCDLKPANVLLDHGWRPRLADFGQSRMSDDQTPSLGTLFFMAPEQADLRASPDAAWDVYALGAIAYTMLVGSPPYRTPEVVETLDTASSLPDRLKRYRETIRLAPRPKLHYRRRGIDKALCQIIDRCLAVRPEHRFHNVQQVIEAIDSRNRARSRRPLYLIGIVGPILLMLLMLMFSARSINVAKQESLQRVQELALKGNQQTAVFAKLTLESKIESLFQQVERETLRPELHQLLNEITDEYATTLDILSDGSTHPELRQQFIADTRRQRVDQYLHDRLQTMIARESDGSGVAVLNSVLLVEPRGTNIGAAFYDPHEELAETPVGRNFAFRSYFNGSREDGDRNLHPSTFKPMRHPHLSASFRSTSTGNWKMGISTPVWAERTFSSEPDDAPPPHGEPIAVLILTVNLGDFVLLSDVSAGVGSAQFTTLVDGRSGNQRGTLLQHPLIQSMDRETMLRSKMPQIDEQQLEQLQNLNGILDYEDPAAEMPGGRDFAGTWIAAMAQVQLPRSARTSSELTANVDQRPASDLWVLVQEKSSTVSAPVTELGARLQMETYMELGVLLLVVLAMWAFVFRVGQIPLNPTKRWRSTSSGFGGSTAHSSPFESTVDSHR